MTSEIRANTLKNRVGLGTVSFTNTGPVISGVVTATNFVGGLPIAYGADNRVITASSASAIQGEQNLTFNSSTLAVTGNITATGNFVANGTMNVGSYAVFGAVVGADPGSNYYGTTNRFGGGVSISGALNIDGDIGHIGDTNTKIRFPANDTFTVETNGSERIRIDANGNMGLGTNSLVGDASNVYLTVNGSTLGGIALKANGTTQGYLQGTSSLIRLSSDGSKPITFDTNGSERLRIDSNGRTLFSRGGLTASRNVGTKTGEIQVANSGNSSAITIIGYSNDVAGPHLVFGKSRAGNATGSTVLQSGDRLGEIAFCGADGTDIDSFGAAIKAHVDGTPGANDMPGRLEFYTTPDGGSSSVERLRITNDGKVGINDSSPTEMLDVGGAVQASQGFKTAGHPVVTYASFTDISGGSYATRLGSTGTSTLRHTQIYTGGSHQATFDGVNNRLGLRTTKPQTTLNVIGTISTGRNVARELGTVINVSSSHHITRAGSNVINGKKNYENQGSDWLTQGNARNNANLTIDLGSSISCDRFVIYNQNEYQTSHREVKNFTLEGSNDNSSWTTVLDDNAGCSNAHEPNPGWSFRMPADRDDDEEGVSYRYWRFTMKDFHGSDPYGGVMELELYETSNTNGEVESEVSTHSLVATDVSAEIVRANGQPAFCVARSSTQPSSGDYSANTNIIFDNDTGGGYFQTGTDPHAHYYNTSNGVFTAPMSGIYFFTTTVLVQNSTGNYDLIIKTTARDFYCAPGRKASNPGGTSWSTSGTVYLAFGGEVITYMKKGEQAEVRFTTFGGGQIYGSGSWTRFAGYLLG